MRIAACIAWWITAVPLSAGQKELSWENIFKANTGAREAAISPDGKWVAVTADTDSGRSIYLVSTAGGEPEPWVMGGSPSWHPESRGIVFVQGDDLWSVGLHERNARRLTHDEADERAPVYSPDGRKVAYYSSRSAFQDIWLVPAGGENAPRQLTRRAMAADDPRFSPAFSPDGRSIVYVSNADDYWHDDLWVVEIESGASRKLTRSLMASSTPVHSPNGKRIALLGTAKDEYWYEDLAYLYLIDAASGAESRVDMSIFATDWLNNLGVFWSGEGRELYFLYHERGDLNLWSVRAEGGVATRIASTGGAVTSFAASADASGFVLVRSTPTRGNEVDYVSRSGGFAKRLTHFSPEWRGIQEPRELSYRTFDGLYIQGFLYLPPGFDESSRYPALVNVHGGGTNSYLRRDNLIEQVLARKGYLVLAINYRGGSGFGRRFQDLSVRDWANGQAKDAAAAADFLRSLPYVNGKVGIYGYSYGGIMTMATIARSPGTFDAAVPMAGIYDFADAYTNADRLGKIFTKTGHGGAPEERPDTYGVSNTLARMKDIDTPLLIMHGEADVRAPFRQYLLALDILKKYDKEFESKSYPGEPHGFRNPDDRVDMYHRLEAFFEKHLKR